MREISDRPGIYDKPVDLNVIPFTPYKFFISRWGGIMTADGTKWFGFPSNNSIQLTSSRYFGYYNRPIKCIEYLSDKGNVVFVFRQDYASYDFNFTSSGKSILEIYLKPSTLTNRRTFLATLSVCQQYQTFFKQHGSKTLYFDLYIKKGNAFVRQQTYGLDSCRAGLTNLQRNWKTFQNTDKLHTSGPRLKVIGSKMKKLKKKYREQVEIEKSNYLDEDSNFFTKTFYTDIIPKPEQWVGITNSNFKEQGCLVDHFKFKGRDICRCIDFNKRGEACPTFYLMINGDIATSCYLDNCIIKSLFTEPKYRKQGYASTLLDFIIENEKVLGIKPEAYSDSPLSNEMLRNWYLSKGLKVF